MLHGPRRVRAPEPRRGCYGATAASWRAQEGFKDVVHLEGGLSQWRHDGYPIGSK